MAKYAKAVVIIEAEFQVDHGDERSTEQQITAHIDNCLNIYVRNKSNRVVVKVDPDIHHINGCIDEQEAKWKDFKGRHKNG